MPLKTIRAARFKTRCLRLIDEVAREGRPVTITKHGRPVAVLRPVAPSGQRPLIGALKGSVLRFDDPFSPVVDWADAAR